MHKRMSESIQQKCIAHEYFYWLEIFLLCLIGHDILHYKFPWFQQFSQFCESLFAWIFFSFFSSTSFFQSNFPYWLLVITCLLLAFTSWCSFTYPRVWSGKYWVHTHAHTTHMPAKKSRWYSAETCILKRHVKRDWQKRASFLQFCL